MTAWRLVRDALLVAAAAYLLVGAVNLTLGYFAWYFLPPTGWDVLVPDPTVFVLLYLMGVGLLAVVWLSRRRESRTGFDPAETM